MAKRRSKRFQRELLALEHLKSSKREVAVTEAVSSIISACSLKFEPTLDAVFNLNIDPKKGDQNVRGACPLPYGLGKEIKVAVFARGSKAEEARKAGADYVGAEDLVASVLDGNLDFQTVIATPDCMALIAKVGKILGPRGLMPSPKTGTVTLDVETAVREAKAGKVEFRNDKGGSVHVPVGKVSFGVEKLEANLKAIASAIQRAKPAAVKGNFIKSVFLSHSQGPSVRVRVADLVA